MIATALPTCYFGKRASPGAEANRCAAPNSPTDCCLGARRADARVVQAHISAFGWKDLEWGGVARVICVGARCWSGGLISLELMFLKVPWSARCPRRPLTSKFRKCHHALRTSSPWQWTCLNSCYLTGEVYFWWVVWVGVWAVISDLTSIWNLK